jgi:hypothetical protein
MAAMGSSNSAWLTTSELCAALAISRSKLCRWQQRKVFRQGVHWVRKNITTRKGADGPLFDWSVQSLNQAASL